MPKPLVSVIIPAFNEERFIAEAIESALAQTYEPVEVVVVDDGSTDATGQIAATFPDVELVSQVNRGLSAARNAGVAAAAGEIIAFNDADDIMLPERLETQVDHLLENESVGCVLAEQVIEVEDGAELPFWVSGTDKPLIPVEIHRRHGGHPNIHTVTMLMRRSLYIEMGGFDPGQDFSGDVDILLRLMESGVEIARVPTPVVRRRVHANNMTQGSEESRQALFRLFKARIDRKRAAG